MKKLEFKGVQKIKLALAITGVSMLVGCGSKTYEYDITVPTMQAETAVMEETTAGLYNAENYYLIRLNGNVYLATKTIEIDEHNTIERYYDVKTGDLVGQVLSVDFVDRAMMYAQITGNGQYDFTIENRLYDYDYYGGVYGYGRNISPYAILPLQNVLDSNVFGEQEMEYYSSNAYELQEVFANTMAVNTICVTSSIDYQMDYNFGKNNSSYDYTSNTISKFPSVFTCEKEGITQTLVGERLAYHKKDNGYNYVYDFITGYIYYIGDKEEIHYDTVVETEYLGEATTFAEVTKDLTIGLDTAEEEPVLAKVTNELPVKETYSLSSLYLVVPSNYNISDSNFYICSQLNMIEYPTISCSADSCELHEGEITDNRCYGKSYVTVGLKANEQQKQFTFAKHMDENFDDTSTIIINFGDEQKVYEMQELDENLLREIYSGYVPLRYILEKEDIKDEYTNDELIALNDKLRTLDYALAIAKIESNSFFNLEIQNMMSTSAISEEEVMESFAGTEVCTINDLVLINNSTLDNENDGYTLGQNVRFYQPLFEGTKSYVVSYDTSDCYDVHQCDDAFMRASTTLSPEDIKPYYTEEEVEELIEKVQDPDYQFNNLSTSSLLVAAVMEEEINACAIYVLDNQNDYLQELSIGSLPNKKIMIYNGLKDGITTYYGLQDTNVAGSESEESQVLSVYWKTDSSSGEPSSIINITYQDTIDDANIVYGQELPLISLNEYLEANGYVEYIKDGYTASELQEIEGLLKQEMSLGYTPEQTPTE